MTILTVKASIQIPRVPNLTTMFAERGCTSGCFT